ncbi:HPP family protein [Chloroflexota bacterium]
MRFQLIDKNFRAKASKYALQSIFATVTLIIIFNFMDLITEAVIFAAIGATTFIVFAMPNYVTASPRRVIGGHAVGLFSGSVCQLVLILALAQQSVEYHSHVVAIIAAISVGLTIFLMVITQTEHPPAAGTALGLVVEEWSLSIIFFVIACSILLSVIKFILRRWLIDLI